jgi:hypothetical protein
MTRQIYRLALLRGAALETDLGPPRLLRGGMTDPRTLTRLVRSPRLTRRFAQ